MNQTFNTSSVLPAQAQGSGVWVTLLLGAILLVMCILGVVGNIYTLVVTQSADVRRIGSMYIYIVNLALADLLYLCTIPFVVGTYLAKDWLFGEMGCRVLLSLDLLTMHASVFLLSTMSLERYRAVSQPFLAHRPSIRHHRIVALALWGASFLLTLPMMVMIRLQEARPNPSGHLKRICFPTWTLESFKTYLSILFCTSVLGPGLLIVGLYTGLLRHYWVAQTNLGGSSSSTLRRRLRQKVVSMIFCIILAYWACFLPFWAWQLTKLFSPDTLRRLSPATHTYINFFVTCLTYGNSCVNPLLYTLLTRNYKDYLAQKGQLSGSSRADGGGMMGGASGGAVSRVAVM